MFFHDGRERKVGYRAYLRSGDMADIPFYQPLEAYLDTGEKIYVSGVQTMYHQGAERLMFTYYTHRDLEITQKIRVTTEEIDKLPVYVTDPRPYMTPAGEVLYG